MPPRAKIAREMIVDAALQIARTSGAEQISARSVARALGCSTQPVMYHFARVEDLKRAAYARADALHTRYLFDVRGEGGGALLEIGLNYIRFAVEEPQLFRFLFHSGMVPEHSLREMIASEALAPAMDAVQRDAGVGAEGARRIFMTIALFAHGCASMIANNALSHDERALAEDLARAYRGAVLAEREAQG